MTSGISFFKVIKEEFKHHLVSIFLVVLCFLTEILFFYFRIQNIVAMKVDTSVKYVKEVIAVEGEPSIGAMIWTMVLAVVLAAEYFSYLHSRRKTDFYMSLPIKRSQQFVMGMMVSATIFVIPCVLATGAEMVIGYASGYGTAVFYSNMLWTLLCKLLIFAAMWVTMTLAMIMTGHLVVALLGLGAFCSYIPILIRYLVPVYQDFFFETYVSPRVLDEWYCFSPVTLAIGVAGGYYNWIVTEHLNYIIGCVVFTVIVGGVAFWLYLKRPAEAAGRAMAFEKANAVIRFAIVLPLALYFGYFLSEMRGGDAAKIWLVAGTIIGVILLHGIVESIFNFDLRRMFTKKKQLGFSMLFCLVFILAFQLNIDRFNHYVPEEEEVERVILYFNNESVYFNAGWDWENVSQTGVSGEQIGSVLQLVDHAITLNDNMEQYDSEETLGSITVQYQMKSGKVKQRVYYSLDTEDEENRALLDSIIGTEEFKKDYYHLYKADAADVEEIRVDDTFVDEKLLLTETEKEQFLEIYKKELAALTFSDMEEVERVAQLMISYGDEQTEECHIYANFKETLEFLEAYGIILGNPLEDVEIRSVSFYEEDYGDYILEGLEVTNQEVINEVKNEFVLGDLYGSDYVYELKNTRYAYIEISVNGRMDGREILVRKDVEEVLKNAEN